MIVRPLKAEDAPQVGVLIRGFTSQVPGFGKHVSPPEKFADIVRQGVPTGSVIGAVAESADGRVVGAIAMLMLKSETLSSVSIAQELWFFIEDGFRGGASAHKMMQLAMESAICAGARFILMTFEHSHKPDGTKRFYERFGFVELETTMMKEV